MSDEFLFVFCFHPYACCLRWLGDGNLWGFGKRESFVRWAGDGLVLRGKTITT